MAPKFRPLSRERSRGPTGLGADSDDNRLRRIARATAPRRVHPPLAAALWRQTPFRPGSDGLVRASDIGAALHAVALASAGDVIVIDASGASVGESKASISAAPPGARASPV